MQDFSNYEVSKIIESSEGIYGLANNLLPEMAEALGYDLGERSAEESLKGFIKHIGPAKELQDNIALVQQRLGTNEDAVTIAADWVDRSGLLTPVARAFRDNTELDMSKIDRVVMTGGVANWMIRRGMLIERILPEVPIDIVVGNRQMKEVEHPIVGHLMRNKGEDRITESEFALNYLEPRLGVLGLQAVTVTAETANGNEVFAELFSQYETCAQDDTILVVGNAPSFIQSAGQLRSVARDVNPNFDPLDNEPQLYMISDTIPVARNGEGTATHQNPYSALGQIARSASYIQQATRLA